LVAEGNAIAKTVLHFAIEDNFNLSLCDAPARSKEEQAARAILDCLQQRNYATRHDLIRYLIEIGLANPPASGKQPKAAETLLHRAMVYLQGKVVAEQVGRYVVYRLAGSPITLRNRQSEHDRTTGLPSTSNHIGFEGFEGSPTVDDLHDLHHLHDLHGGDGGMKAKQAFALMDYLHDLQPLYMKAVKATPKASFQKVLPKLVAKVKILQTLMLTFHQAHAVANRLTPDDEGLAVCVGCGRLWRFVNGSWQPEFSDGDQPSSPDLPAVATLIAKNSRAQKAAMKTELEKALRELSIALNALERVCSDMKRKAKKQKHVRKFGNLVLKTLFGFLKEKATSVLLVYSLRQQQQALTTLIAFNP